MANNKGFRRLSIVVGLFLTTPWFALMFWQIVKAVTYTPLGPPVDPSTIDPGKMVDTSSAWPSATDWAIFTGLVLASFGLGWVVTRMIGWVLAGFAEDRRTK